MKKLIGLCLCFLGCTIFHLAQADEAPNECKNFHIQISNLTHAACILTSQKVIHGNLITPPPTSILPNDSKRFDMTQTGYGPAIVLSYQCGAEIITFASKQNPCYLEAGDISGKIFHPLPTNLNASYTALPGSYFWKRSGSINWKVMDLS